jgi:iron complex transport system substrate-binding protein
MNNVKKIMLFFTLFAISLNAVSVKDNKGIFTIDYIPKRIVVLELSFADTLAIVGVSPIGIADDNNKNRLIPELRKKINPWISLGTRSQPNLEIIASLKPDLIIADIRRHEGVYESLKKIAPTLILPSKRITYKESFEINKKIAIVLGKSEEMEKRINKHRKFMKSMSTYLPKNLEVQVSMAREESFFLSTDDSYIAEVIKTLGIKYPKSEKDNNAPRYAGLEQLLSINPEYLIVGSSVSPNIIDSWKKKPLWSMINASKSGHVIKVNDGLWSRSRGIIATEQITKKLVEIFGK